MRIVFAVCVSCLLSWAQSHAVAPSIPVESKWTLTWSDDFEQPNGSAPDPTKWVSEIGGKGWGNNELESYTADAKNAHVENGNLVIEAIKQTISGPDGIRRDYSSARLKTEGKFSQRYGRFEVRAKLPSGKGLWPAFWMLGNDFSKVGWPDCGEIDVMENIGSEPAKNHGSLHGPGYSGSNPLTAVFDLPNGRFSDGFHVFAVEWEPSGIRFSVDDTVYTIRTPSELPAGKRWVFDHPFFIILNVAVGGNMPGDPDGSTVFPQRMLVDYVHVYSRK